MIVGIIFLSIEKILYNTGEEKTRKAILDRRARWRKLVLMAGMEGHNP
jgi:hypothetical protein